nr:MAG TPA: hypothetical protein [Caudoviricetes sp.]
MVLPGAYCIIFVLHFVLHSCNIYSIKLLIIKE